MLAEGVHSVADSANQGLLLPRHGVGAENRPRQTSVWRAKESYFWAFVVALVLFFLGRVYAMYEGIHKLTGPAGEPGSVLAPVIVLTASIGMEGYSFWVAIREFNKSRGDLSCGMRSLARRIRRFPSCCWKTRERCLGSSSHSSRWSRPSDGEHRARRGRLACHRILLCVIGVALIYETKSLLIGEAIKPEEREQVSKRRSALTVSSR